MKPTSYLRRGLIVAALSFLVSTAVSAADNFEGRIHMEMTSGKKKETMGMDYAVKGGKMRIDPQAMESSRSRRGGGGAEGIIFDYPNMEMLILMNMDGQKMYMKRAIPKPSEVSHEREGQPRTAPPVKTGRTEMIAGYKATEYKMTDENGKVIEMWLASGLGQFMSMGNQNPMSGRQAPPPGWEQFVRDGNYFPMRVVTYSAKGVEETRMEVTKVEKTSLPDSLFSADGYSEFQMPGFGGGFNPFKH